MDMGHSGAPGFPLASRPSGLRQGARPALPRRQQLALAAPVKASGEVAPVLPRPLSHSRARPSSHSRPLPRPLSHPCTNASGGRRRRTPQLHLSSHARVQPRVRHQRRHLQQPHQAALRPALRLRRGDGALRQLPPPDVREMNPDPRFPRPRSMGGRWASTGSDLCDQQEQPSSGTTLHCHRHHQWWFHQPNACRHNSQLSPHC